MKTDTIKIKVVSAVNWIKIQRVTLSNWSDLKKLKKILQALTEIDKVTTNHISHLYINNEYRGHYTNAEIRELLLSKAWER
jgi:hypothetical protein